MRKVPELVVVCLACVALCACARRGKPVDKVYDAASGLDSAGWLADGAVEGSVAVGADALKEVGFVDGIETAAADAMDTNGWKPADAVETDAAEVVDTALVETVEEVSAEIADSSQADVSDGTVAEAVDVPVVEVVDSAVLEIPDSSLVEVDSLVDSTWDELEIPDSSLVEVDSLVDSIWDEMESLDLCEVDCDGKDCGYDGCGGLCGVCQVGQECYAGGICFPEELPDCEGKECGPDGVGGGCGICDDGDPTTVDECQEGVCGLCVPDCDCKGCGDDGCGGQCLDCDDGNECTADICDGYACQHPAAIAPGCCQVAGDCDDDDPCTKHMCMHHKCVLVSTQLNCCYDDSDCAGAQACGTYWCNLDGHYCDYVWKSTEEQEAEGLECCTSNLDCKAGGIWEEDGDNDGLPGPDDPDTWDYCTGDQCEHIPYPEECDCESNWPQTCPPDSNPSTTVFCVEECMCLPHLALGSCKTSADCNDANICTNDACVDGKCVSAASCGCCGTDTDCFDGNPCSQDKCVNFCCYSLPHPEPSDCCLSDEDCEDNCSCTIEVCYYGTCVKTAAPDPGCCVTSSDCEDDGEPCTVAECVHNHCQQVPVPGC